jgi:hypothetical protein
MKTLPVVAGASWLTVLTALTAILGLTSSAAAVSPDGPTPVAGDHRSLATSAGTWAFSAQKDARDNPSFFPSAAALPTFSSPGTAGREADFTSLTGRDMDSLVLASVTLTLR